ncbi:hypothetical protein QYF36_012111 [Acer negundo]|nr:hypothetical protein QYF36_012111 [Acer negundo]
MVSPRPDPVDKVKTVVTNTTVEVGDQKLSQCQIVAEAMTGNGNMGIEAIPIMNPQSPKGLVLGMLTL